jgi:hypothetical protein
MSKLQAIALTIGGIAGTIIGVLGINLTYDALAAGQIIGGLIVILFVCLPGIGMTAGIGIAMAMERDRTVKPPVGTYGGDCADDMFCWCRECAEYKTGLDLPD